MRSPKVVALAALFLAAPVYAQTVEITGVYQSVSGDDFEGTESGLGAAGEVLFGVSQLLVGGGVSYISHGIEGIDENLKNLTLFGEVRYPFSAGGSIIPFAAGRFGYTRSTLSLGGNDAKATGWTYGGELGATFPLSPTLSIVGAAYYHRVSLGDVEVNGTEFADTDSSGGAFGIRAGIHLHFGAAATD